MAVSRWSSVAWSCALAAACGGHANTIDAPSTPWSLSPSQVPDPRLEPGVTALGQQLVVLGGFDTDVQQGLDITQRVDVFDPTAQTWSTLPDAPVAWTHIQLVGIGTTLYLLGGLAGSMYVAHGESFVLETTASPMQWTPIASMPVGMERGSAAIAVSPNRIYLMGGASTANALQSVIYYDLTTDSWGQLPDLPAPRSHPAGMITPDGTLVLAGGLSGLFADSFAGDVWQLPPGATEWSTGLAAMPDARGGCMYGVIQGQLVCAAGEAATSALTYTETYDPLGDKWSENTAMPVPTAGTQGAVIASRLYIPGGARELQFFPTDTLYIYAPLDVVGGDTATP
ncbi:MAG TPA: kelch repeat-containing protein [Kofleriaceae bacterium]|nr:kelch repeat-containing protein [Kofleriaceae bacterium]